MGITGITSTYNGAAVPTVEDVHLLQPKEQIALALSMGPRYQHRGKQVSKKFLLR